MLICDFGLGMSSDLILATRDYLIGCVRSL
jgi:hypothetical protein